MNEPIVYDDRNPIAILRVNRPHVRNALNWAAQDAFAAAIRATAENDGLRALVITGTGTAFVSGGDLKELATQPDAEAGKRLSRVMTGALAQLAELPIPVVAAINGDAAGGGCELLAACDLRIAVRGAVLKFVQVRVGLTTGWGGTARLVHLLGQSRAMEILLSGRTLTTEMAHDIGLVHHLVAQGEPVLPAALAWADEIAKLPRDAVAAMKQLLYAATRLTWQQTSALERRLFLSLWGTSDHLHALQAFGNRDDAEPDSRAA